MKAITYTFERDWWSIRSIPGTGETEREPAGRAPDKAIYIVECSSHEPLARAQFEHDFRGYNPTKVEHKIDDVKGIVHCTRRLT